jgi:hypothetical protein
MMLPEVRLVEDELVGQREGGARSRLAVAQCHHVSAGIGIGLSVRTVSHHNLAARRKEQTKIRRNTLRRSKDIFGGR